MRRLIVSAMMACLFCSGIAAYAVGSAPVAENLELCTYRNVSVGGRMKAFDPDDDVVAYEITTEPVKGCIEAASDGSFVYTPNENKKGRDYFGYKAKDSEGNYSQEATVIIKIDKQKKDVSYADMAGSGDEYCAVELSEREIFTGEQICGQYCFFPDKEVSRGEFISMCIMAADEPMIKGVMRTGLEDDAEIPAWMKDYVMCSVMGGMDYGDNLFDYDSAMDAEEAAVMLDRTFGLNNISYVENVDDAASMQACANLEAVGILSDGIIGEEKLTRADAARMLVNAIKVLENR